jgi:tRNA (cytidine/uridine-2'-O-)-methyltransferase
MIRVVLYQPEIPQNTGNIARTCAATNTPLHLIEPLGFSLKDKYLKRAGLDYWGHVRLYVHREFDEFLSEIRPARCVILSKRGQTRYHEFQYKPGDCLIFGSETRGLPVSIVESVRETVLNTARPRFKIRRIVGKNQFQSKVEDFISWYCTSCSECSIRCPRDVKPSELVIESRSMVVEQGQIPGQVEKALENTLVHKNPLAQIKGKNGRIGRKLDFSIPHVSETRSKKATPMFSG